MTRNRRLTRPATADIERSLALLGRAASREAVPSIDVRARVMVALARQRTAAATAAAALPDDGAASLGWLAAAAFAAAVIVALLALPALGNLSGPLVEIYDLLGGGAL